MQHVLIRHVLILHIYQVYIKLKILLKVYKECVKPRNTLL